ncbi:MAG: glycoside hydrolase family 97 catalytic domain-containing protein, partial [Planctomycetales bacterium]|nr:glycoside hydrolase family 97 catalytic domain-containing protein [Planctomycetales bacterium]
PPCEMDDVSWVKPGKVSWDWWNNLDLFGVDFSAGVNTDSYLHMIDFAAEYGLQYIILDEGWSDTRDVMRTAPDIDLEKIVAHGKQKGVGVILWVTWNGLDRKMEEALDAWSKLGVAGVKVDFMQRDDQWMMDFYWRAAEATARRKMLIDFHGACKPTGLRRTFPNVISYEGVTGLEQYKWTDEITTPDQELTLPFIRMVAGPMDFTPGGMRNADRRSFKPVFDHPMTQGTRCHQLAMYVIFESPLQMLADSPSEYRRQPECMKFLSQVPTTWDDTRVLHAKVGDVIALARRSGEDWYVAAMTDWTPRELDLDLSFLPSGAFQLEAWADGVNAARNANDFRRESRQVSQTDQLKVELAPGGGWAGWLRPAAR